MARDEIMGAQSFEHGNWRDPNVRYALPPSPTSVDPKKIEQIHSGHFMISNPHRIKKHGYNFEDAVRSPSTSYRFGKGDNDIFEIDSSFAKLFECLSLAYNGAAIISPKWKDFKGMKLSWKDKIRLNNAIWREWHCQFVFGYKPVLCHFSFPITDLIHSTPQAVVLEGKYWKRTLGTVVKEYMKWRTFFKKRRTSSFSADGGTEPASPFQDQLFQEIMRNHSPEPVPMVLDEEALMSEFTDTLFSSLNHNFMFPNPKELSHLSTNADIMQPGLVQLQPSIDELMDTFEPLQDVMRSVAQSVSPSTFVFTGRTSSKPILQPGQFTLNGSASSSSAQQAETAAAAASLEMAPQAEQSSMMDGITLEDSMTSDVQTLNVISDQQQDNQQQQMLNVTDLQQQPQQFSTQPISANQQYLVAQQQQVLQPQQQQLSTHDISSQLIATQQRLDEVTRQQHQLTQQVTAAQSLEQQQQVVSQQFGREQLQQQQQIQLIQQQQQQLLLSQQTQLQNLGITLSNVPSQPATLHSTGGEQTHILLNSADISNLQSQLSGNSQIHQGASITTLQGMNTTQQVMNPLTSVQVRIAPANDMNSAVKVATPVHQMAQQQHRTVQQQQSQTLRTLNQAQGAAATGTASAGEQHTQLGLETLVGGNQTHAKQLLQQLANQASQNNQQPQQQGIPMQQQQEDSKAIFTQIFGGQTVIPSGNSNFISIQPQQQPIQQQQQQEPFPIQITKAEPMQKKSSIKTRTAQAVPGAPRSVISIAKLPSQTKASSSVTTSNTSQSGSKVKIKRQPKTKAPPKIAPAPPVVTSTNSMMSSSSTSNAALLTQLLTQGRLDSAARATSAPAQPTIIQPPAQQTIANTLLIQPVKSEKSISTTTCTLPVATYVTTELPSGVPFLVSTTNQPFFSTPPIATTTNMNRFLGVSKVDIASSPSTAETSPAPSFTIGMVSSPPSSSEGFPMDQTEMVENRPQTPKKETHISAEQKRRVNIKSGFDMLNTIVPALVQNPNAKISKAQMLQKAVDYTKKLQHERSNTNEEIEKLRQEVAGLNVAISETQSQLPASGVPVTRQRFDKMKDVYDEYVRDRTATNWKFWIFSIIIRPLFESYNASVSTASTEELFRTVLSWLDQHCSLLALRPTVLSSLTLLSRTTSILSDPAQVPQQAADAVSKRNDPDNDGK